MLWPRHSTLFFAHTSSHTTPERGFYGYSSDGNLSKRPRRPQTTADQARFPIGVSAPPSAVGCWLRKRTSRGGSLGSASARSGSLAHYGCVQPNFCFAQAARRLALPLRKACSDIAIQQFLGPGSSRDAASQANGTLGASIHNIEKNGKLGYCALGYSI